MGIPSGIDYPQRFKPAQQRKEAVSLIDVGPTLVEVAHAGSWITAAGNSLFPLLADASANWVNEAFSEYPPSKGQPAQRMIRSGKWKLVHYDGMQPQLFNLESDPHEFHDLGEDPEYEQIRKKLLDRVLQGWSAKLVGVELTMQERDQDIVRRWYEKVDPPPSPQQWIAPPNVNKYPE